MQNMLFIVKKGYFDFLNGSFRTCSLKGSLGNQKRLFYGITAITPNFQPLFLRVLESSHLIFFATYKKFKSFFLKVNEL